jgi:hypothetical protein
VRCRAYVLGLLGKRKQASSTRPRREAGQTAVSAACGIFPRRNVCNHTLASSANPLNKVLKLKLSFLNDAKDLAALGRRAARQAQLASQKLLQCVVARNPPWCIPARRAVGRAVCTPDEGSGYRWPRLDATANKGVSGTD